MILNYYGVHIESSDTIRWKASENNILLVLTTDNGLSIYNYESGAQLFTAEYNINSIEIKELRILEFVGMEPYFMCVFGSKHSKYKTTMLINAVKNTCDFFEECEDFVQDNIDYIYDNLKYKSSYLLTGNVDNIVMYQENQHLYTEFDWVICNTLMPSGDAIYRVKVCLNTNKICAHEFVKYF
jgi:hypothetical protein